MKGGVRGKGEKRQILRKCSKRWDEKHGVGEGVSPVTGCYAWGFCSLEGGYQKESTFFNRAA